MTLASRIRFLSFPRRFGHLLRCVTDSSTTSKMRETTTMMRVPPTQHRSALQELRERQAMAEKSALEAKRARVMEDMKRRQQRLQRLQEEEG